MKLYKIGYMISGIISIAAIFNSCKKQDSRAEAFNEKKAIDALRSKMSNQGAAQITSIHKRATSITYYDKNGNEHLLDLTNKKGTALGRYPISAACDPGLTNCTNAEGDGSLLQTPDILLEYSTRLTYCGNASNPDNTSDIEVIWQLSVPYSLSDHNLFGNTSLPSKGRIRFRNTLGQIIQNYLSVPLTTITNLGVDPTCADRTVFEVKYKQTGIPNSNFASGISMENNFSIYTDCDAQTALTLTYWDIETIQPVGSTPCGRTDKIYINPNSGPDGVPAALGVGNVIGCSFPSYPTAWVYPDLQHIEYKPINASTWYVHDISPFGYLWMSEITPGSGTWNIRYRNQMNSPCDGPWYAETWSF